ncbi:MAG TPA: hypothetical protein VK820_00100 [Steroidobacteraceae bacterium]|nr:hypothetical protein [Steroidobacteraceae bacterium]
MYDSVRIALEDAANDNHTSVDLGRRPKLNVAEHCDNVAADRAVDVDVSQHCHGGIAHRTGGARIPEDRHHRILDIACTARRAKNGDDCICALALGKPCVMTDGDYVVDRGLSLAVMLAGIIACWRVCFDSVVMARRCNRSSSGCRGR